MSTENSRHGSDQFAEQANNSAKEQSGSSTDKPLRAYGSLTTDYYEQLFSTQFDAVRNFAEKSLAQSRSWLEVKDSDSFQKVADEQQKAIREMSERLMEDTKKINSLCQEYLNESQQLAMESMEVGRKQLEENMQQGNEQLKENMQQGNEQFKENMQQGKHQFKDNTQQSKERDKDNMQKGQHQADKSTKTTSTPNN